MATIKTSRHQANNRSGSPFMGSKADDHKGGQARVQSQDLIVGHRSGSSLRF